MRNYYIFKKKQWHDTLWYELSQNVNSTLCQTLFYQSIPCGKIYFSNVQISIPVIGLNVFIQISCLLWHITYSTNAVSHTLSLHS